MDNNIEKRRMSDKNLERFLKYAEGEIRVREAHGRYDVGMDRLILMELVRRELERKERGDGDD